MAFLAKNRFPAIFGGPLEILHIQNAKMHISQKSGKTERFDKLFYPRGMCIWPYLLKIVFPATIFDSHLEFLRKTYLSNFEKILAQRVVWHFLLKNVFPPVLSVIWKFCLKRKSTFITETVQDRGILIKSFIIRIYAEASATFFQKLFSRDLKFLKN